MGQNNPKKLIVEGNDDKFSVASLMGFYVEWPDQKEKAPVHIDGGNGAEEILSNKFLITELKAPGLQVLGVMLDANGNSAQERYGTIRYQVSQTFPHLPDDLPADGLIAENLQHLRFGVWIMPDNAFTGDLELFLKELVPDVGVSQSWKYAVDVVDVARTQKNCPCRPAHVSKANLYTWLAWQEPPGQSPGRALTQKILDPHCDKAKPFVQWFMKLYSLAPLQQAVSLPAPP
jgi:hypothetical protein